MFGFTTDPRFQSDAQSPYELTRRRIKSGMTAADFAAIFGARPTYIKLSPSQHQAASVLP